MSTPHDPWSAGPPASGNPDPTPPDAAQAEAGQDDPSKTGAEAGGSSDSPRVDPNATQIRPVQGSQAPPAEPSPWNAPANPQPSSYPPPPPPPPLASGQPGYGAPQPGYPQAQSQPGYSQPGYGQPGYGQPGYSQGQSHPGQSQPGQSQPPGQSQQGYGQPGYQQPAGYQTPGYQPPAGYQAPGYQAPGYQAPGYQTPGYQTPGSQAPGYESPGASASAKGSSRKRPLIIGLCAVLVLALATVGFLVLKPSSSPAFTFAGKKIANSDAVLTAAQSTTAKLVTSRHGASNSDTRCYFARATSPAKGTKKSDIDDHAYCGPVLFVDGDKAQTYLSYPISQAGTKAGAVTLTAATTPTSPEPQSAPAGKTLARPDKLAPKTSSLAVPAPPPAAAGVFSTTADVSGQTIPTAPTTAVIGSRTGGVDLTNLGPITRYGRGDDARSAPTGQKLIAFKTAAGPDEDGILRFPDGTITVTVAGQSHSVPRASSTVVLAVPTSATAADLVVADAGVTQRISLLSGKPAATNIAVDRRLHHVGNTGGPKVVTFSVSAGPDKVTRKARASLQGSDLRYWVRAGDNRHASSPGTALLFVDLEYSYTEAIKAPFTAAASYGPYGFAPELLKLHLPGGKVVSAGNYSTDKDKLYILFPVPATFTSGTVVISGSEAPNKNGVSLGISGSSSFAVRVAAG